MSIVPSSRKLEIVGQFERGQTHFEDVEQTYLVTDRSINGLRIKEVRVSRSAKALPNPEALWSLDLAQNGREARDLVLKFKASRLQDFVKGESEPRAVYDRLATSLTEISTFCGKKADEAVGALRAVASELAGPYEQLLQAFILGEDISVTMSVHKQGSSGKPAEEDFTIFLSLDHSIEFPDDGKVGDYVSP